MSSLPVPVSPVIKTAEFVGATCATSCKAEISGSEVPTMPSNTAELSTSVLSSAEDRIRSIRTTPNYDALLIFTPVLLVL